MPVDGRKQKQTMPEETSALVEEAGVPGRFIGKVEISIKIDRSGD